MSFVLTGVQHLKSGDVIIPALNYEDRDGYLGKYHQEMAYAHNNPDFLGLGILVYDTSSLGIMLVDNWVREIEEPIEEEEPGEDINSEE